MIRLIDCFVMKFLVLGVSLASSPWEFTGTTPNIREIFLGRCWQYQVLTSLNKLDFLTYNVNCSEVWDLFYKAVAFKHICDVTEDDYRPLFNLLARPKKLKDKVCAIAVPVFLFFKRFCMSFFLRVICVTV